MGSEPNDNDTIRLSAWKTITREAIIHIFTAKSGLQLKLSAKDDKIFCRARAPMKLLELQADRENYRLQFKGEIDPGSDEFWNKEVRGKSIELEEEKKIYNKDDGNAILEKLYRSGKISPNDLGINSQKEIARTWSLRIHALERIADKVPVFNNYSAYTAFSSQPHHRYLYQNYNSVRGKTLFRPKDRLYLTKSIIDRYFDVDVFVENQVVDCILALHDANRGEKIALDVLQRRWVSFWRCSAKEVGSPYVTHYAYEEDEEVWFYLRPFSQPLSDIRDYFGEGISMYYAWLGFYTYYLTIPAFAGIIMIIIYASRGYIDTIQHIDTPLVSMTVIITIWSSYYSCMWNKETEFTGVKWGTKGFEEEEKARPSFYGIPTRSFVDNQVVAYYPKSKRSLLMASSFLTLAFVILLFLCLVGGIFYLESLFELDDFEWIVAFIQAILIQLSNFIYTPLARYLNGVENHRTETDFEDVLIIKLLSFQLINNFSALVFTSFGKNYFFDTCHSGNCMYDLRVLLIATIITRFIFDILRLARPYLTKVLQEVCCKVDKNRRDKGLAMREEQVNLTSDPDDSMYFIDEINRNEYDGTLNGYAEGVVQFGYVNWYTMAMPITGIVAILENLLKIRLEAWQLCAFTRRPPVRLIEDTTMWQSLMELMSYLGCINSVAVVVFTSTSFTEYSFTNKVILFLVTEQLLLLFKYLLQYILPVDHDLYQSILKRQNFIVNKYLKGFGDNNNDDLNATLKGNLEDVVDVDGMNLYDLRKTKTFSESEYEEMSELEKKRRTLLNDLRLAKDHLNTVYKTERLNEQTGVGETKHGLPLGRLSVKLMQIEDCFCDDLDDDFDKLTARVRVDIKGYGINNANAGPPLSAERSYSNPLEFNNDGFASINQSLGPFAPIRTQDADVVFDIVLSGANQIEKSIATASVKLRELSEQKPVDMHPHLKVRNKVSGVFEPSEARIFLTLTFQYSKLVPLRNSIYELQDELRQVEKNLSKLKAGTKDFL